MKNPAVWLSIGLLAFVSVCFGQSDVESLKATHKILAQSVISGNVNLFVKRIHPRALGFFRNSQLIVQFTPQRPVQDMAPSLIAELSDYISVTTQDEYRVVGDTGVVCSTFARTPTTGQNKKKRTEYNRGTYVYNRSQGEWLLVSWHTSAVPLN